MCEIFPGFTPSLCLSFSLPQFLFYARHANEQKAYKLDVRTVNDYISQIFGTKQPKDPSSGKLASTVDCKIDHDDKINNVFNIRDARNSLRRKTGKKSFSMNEIIREIGKMKPNDQYKIIEPKER